MTVREILRMGDPRLLQKAKPITEFNTPELQVLIEDMFETMVAANGAGLAAPQIGISLQLVIFGFEDNSEMSEDYAIPKTILINPKIRPVGEKVTEAWEGCLSLPGMRGVVPRWAKVHYEGYDQFGQKISREASGFHARVVQHECDHLNGILYPMRMDDLSLFGYIDAMEAAVPRE